MGNQGDWLSWRWLSNVRPIRLVAQLVNDQEPTTRLRLALHGLLVLAVLVVGMVNASDAGRFANAAPPSAKLPPAAPAGQHLVSVLPKSATAFAKSRSGWTARGGVLRWTRASGHNRRGALRLTAGSGNAVVSSPTFVVRPGVRYLATGAVRAAGKAAWVGVGLAFYSVSGQQITAANQVGQAGVATSRRWGQLPTVVGFAPPGAARGRVVVLSRTARASLYVDDIQAARVAGAPARIVGPLHTQGTWILDARGRRVALRGIELDGMNGQYVQSLADMLQQVDVAHAWGANMIRFPLDADRWLILGCVGSSDYRSRVQQVIDRATHYGMLVELDLHDFALNPCGTPHFPPLPDQRGVAFWRQVAATYAGNSLVAYDLYNEPHPDTANQWRNGGLVTYAGVTYQGIGMQKLYDTVRGTGARNLVFVSGPDWTTVPVPSILTGSFNVVYAAHVYTCPVGLPNGHNHCVPGPGGITDPSGRLASFSAWRAAGPIVVDEFGYPDAAEGRYNTNVIAGTERRRWSGWAAYTFDGTGEGMFDLARNSGPIEDPSPAGMAVMVGLLRN